MFEIERKAGGCIHPEEVGLPYRYLYDFTFENRYHVFHERTRTGYQYICYDTENKTTSAVCARKTMVEKQYFSRLIPDLLFAIKYNGDNRHLGAAAYDPYLLIDLIFRVIMPECGYAIREAQISMAKAIYQGLTTRRITLCEAEVGTGKTMAYLVAGFVAQINDDTRHFQGHPVTITTSSIELQKMVMEHELPALSQMLETFGLMHRPLRAVLRKGKEHYFCPKRYREYITTIKNYPEKYSRTMAQLGQNDLLRTGLDLDPLELSPHVKSNICVQGSCKDCKYPHHCAYAEFFKKATNRYYYDFQITNHNLFLTCRKMPNNQVMAGSLLNSHFVIIDEAHKLSEIGTEIFGNIIDPQMIKKYLTSVIYTQKATSKDRRQYIQLLKEADALRQKLAHMLIHSRPEPTVMEYPVRCVYRCTIMSLLDRLSRKLQQIENINRPQGRGNAPSATSLIDQIKGIQKSSLANCWVRQNQDDESVILYHIPTSSAEQMKQHLWSDPNMKWGLASGTMCDDTGFNFFKKELGIAECVEENAVVEYRCESPFDYKNHTRLYISENVPYPDADDENYISAVAKEVVQLVRATRGRTAILFTSYKLLSAVFELVKPQLTEYPLIQMTRSNKTAISQFKESGNGILFASGSMWEGVDCAGDILSSVIIVRLPFPRRTQAMEQKKLEYASVHDFVRNYAVPQMIIKLRQGAGRLIRTESDTGILAILDARAAKGGSYRSRVLAALRKYPLVGSVREIEAFIDRVKDDSYKKGV